MELECANDTDSDSEPNCQPLNDTTKMDVDENESTHNIHEDAQPTPIEMPNASYQPSRVPELPDLPYHWTPESNTILENNCWIEDYPKLCGVRRGRGVSTFEKIQNKQIESNEAPWAPFESEEEWGLAHWLMTSGMSQKCINAMLKLKIVSEMLLAISDLHTAKPWCQIFTRWALRVLIYHFTMHALF